MPDGNESVHRERFMLTGEREEAQTALSALREAPSVPAEELGYAISIVLSEAEMETLRAYQARIAPAVGPLGIEQCAYIALMQGAEG